MWLKRYLVRVIVAELVVTAVLVAYSVLAGTFGTPQAVAVAGWSSLGAMWLAWALTRDRHQ